MRSAELAVLLLNTPSEKYNLECCLAATELASPLQGFFDDQSKKELK